jgi:hypothetical protein
MGYGKKYRQENFLVSLADNLDFITDCFLAYYNSVQNIPSSE